MQDYLYSAAALLAIVIHLIINFNMLPGRRGRRSEKVYVTRYRAFLAGLFAYYLTDACWGIFAGLGWTRILYADTVLYFIAIALTVLAWCRFIIAYLDLCRWKSRLLSWSGYALLALYVALLVANLYINCLFSFDENGAYTPGHMRYLLFYPLVVLNSLTAVFVLVKIRNSHDAARRRNTVVFLSCLTMAVAIVMQIAWPLWPYYAIGCLVANCFFHVFVVEDEHDELRRAVIEREQAAMHAAELEKALERARSAEKARSMFFSIVSHDIRTPLNAILGYAELLQFGVKSEDEREEALMSIRASGTTLLELVNDVLDLAKMDSGKMTFQPEPLRLSHLVDEVFASFHMAAAEKGIKLVNLTASVPTVMLDEHRFRQILFNLIGNAVKFTEHGSVTVTASYAETKLEVSVADTGCGIPSDMLTRILDPFVQVDDASHSSDRAVGTGLGLSICRRLVEAMGGELIVESELGKGSIFKASIPGVQTSKEKARPAAAPKPAVVLKKLPKHVLVIDDSPVNRAVLRALLRKVGIVAIGHAGDGVEALEQLDSALEAGTPYDFIFSDFWMPNMNGLELIEKLRADSRFKYLTAFAVTADAEYHTDSRAALFNGVLLKPLTYDKLVGVLATLE
jgi:signal transduction histidine kinase